MENSDFYIIDPSGFNVGEMFDFRLNALILVSMRTFLCLSKGKSNVISRVDWPHSHPFPHRKKKL